MKFNLNKKLEAPAKLIRLFLPSPLQQQKEGTTLAEGIFSI